MSNFLEEGIIMFRQIEKHNEFEIVICPSFNEYGSQEELKTILISEIYKLIQKSE